MTADVDRQNRPGADTAPWTASTTKQAFESSDNQRQHAMASELPLTESERADHALVREPRENSLANYAGSPSEQGDGPARSVSSVTREPTVQSDSANSAPVANYCEKAVSRDGLVSQDRNNPTYSPRWLSMSAMMCADTSNTRRSSDGPMFKNRPAKAISSSL